MEKHLVDLGAQILGWGEVEKDSFFGSQLMACAKFPYLFRWGERLSTAESLV